MGLVEVKLFFFLFKPRPIWQSSTDVRNMGSISLPIVLATNDKEGIEHYEQTPKSAITRESAPTVPFRIPPNKAVHSLISYPLSFYPSCIPRLSLRAPHAHADKLSPQQLRQAPHL